MSVSALLLLVACGESGLWFARIPVQEADHTAILISVQAEEIVRARAHDPHSELPTDTAQNQDGLRVYYLGYDQDLSDLELTPGDLPAKREGLPDRKLPTANRAFELLLGEPEPTFRALDLDDFPDPLRRFRFLDTRSESLCPEATLETHDLPAGSQTVLASSDDSGRLLMGGVELLLGRVGDWEHLAAWPWPQPSAPQSALLRGDSVWFGDSSGTLWKARWAEDRLEALESVATTSTGFGIVSMAGSGPEDPLELYAQTRRRREVAFERFDGSQWTVIHRFPASPRLEEIPGGVLWLHPGTAVAFGSDQDQVVSYDHGRVTVDVPLRGSPFGTGAFRPGLGVVLFGWRNGVVVRLEESTGIWRHLDTSGLPNTVSAAGPWLQGLSLPENEGSMGSIVQMADRARCRHFPGRETGFGMCSALVTPSCSCLPRPGVRLVCTFCESNEVSII